MNSSIIFYDNQSIQYTLSNVTNSSAYNAYLLSFTRFILYSTARCCQFFIGIPGNIMTLMIVWRLRYRLNMHIIMVYMAVSDILSAVTLPMAIFIHASKIQLVSIDDHWDTLCIARHFFDTVAISACYSYYVVLSLDR